MAPDGKIRRDLDGGSGKKRGRSALARESCVPIERPHTLLHRRKPDRPLAAFDMSLERLEWFASRNKNRRQPHDLDPPAGDDRVWRRADEHRGSASPRAGRLSQPQHQADRAISGRRRPPTCSARLVADQIKSGLNAVVVVENKPGAATTLGAEQMARSEPDGYTIMDRDLDHAWRSTRRCTRSCPTIPSRISRRSRWSPRVPILPDHQSRHSGQDADRVHRLRQGQSGPCLWLGGKWQSAAFSTRNAALGGRHRHSSCALPRQRAGDARRDRGSYSLHGGRPAPALQQIRRAR